VLVSISSQLQDDLPLADPPHDNRVPGEVALFELERESNGSSS
jgi:hypothetical protein